MPGLKCVISLLSISLATQPVWTSSEWSLERVKVIQDLKVPESVLVDPAGGGIYVSNIEAVPGEYWSDDGRGFVSLLTGEGSISELRWLDSTSSQPLNSPKGMCILDGWLYFTDNSRLMRCRLDNPTETVEAIPLDGADRLNDLATDGKAVWVSDVAGGEVWRVDPSGGLREIPAPASVNGLTFHDGVFYAVSWDLHEVYELDLEGKNAPQPFGLASHFTGLDGIEVLEDGTFIISDYLGKKVCSISPDKKKVRVLATLECPADIGVDRARGLLYVPQLEKDQVVVFRLERK
jgi:sugar lactone lactonase YvrE